MKSGGLSWEMMGNLKFWPQRKEVDKGWIGIVNVPVCTDSQEASSEFYAVYQAQTDNVSCCEGSTVAVPVVEVGSD